VEILKILEVFRVITKTGAIRELNPGPLVP
jgi:hypothetical protein